MNSLDSVCNLEKLDERIIFIVLQLFSYHYHYRSTFTSENLILYIPDMATITATQQKKFATDLTDYAKRRRTDGPYADNLDVDVLIVGGGFGE